MRKGWTIVQLVLLAAMVAVLPMQASASMKVALVFATGGLGDKSFNDSAYEGLKTAKEKLGVDYDYAEPMAITEYQPLLMQFANTRQYDLIICIGFDQADALTEMADQFPQQKFAIVDMVVAKPNVASYVYKEKERGFLMGVAAGLTTLKTDLGQVNDQKVIGVVGGMKIPLIDANIAGYMAGAKYVDPGIKVLHAYANHWFDPAKGKELALAMIEQGADVVWGPAGRSGLGVINAAREKNVFAIGTDANQDYIAPDNVLLNGMKYVDKTVLIAIQQVLDNSFKGEVQVLGVKEGVLGYSKSLLPADVAAALEDVKTRIIGGEITIPDTVEEAQ